jgi:hypothetical protein
VLGGGVDLRSGNLTLDASHPFDRDDFDGYHSGWFVSVTKRYNDEAAYDVGVSIVCANAS